MQDDTIIKVLIPGLLIIASPYIFIFRNIWSRLKDLERRPVCNATICLTRFDKIEKEQSDNNPIFLEIKERLASIEATLKFLIDKK